MLIQTCLLLKTPKEMLKFLHTYFSAHLRDYQISLI